VIILATIQTCHPYSFLENTYTYINGLNDTERLVNLDPNGDAYKLSKEIELRIADKIMEMPLYQAHTTGIELTGSLNYGQGTHWDWRTSFDAVTNVTFNFAQYRTAAFGFGFNCYIDGYRNWNNADFWYSTGPIPLADVSLRNCINWDFVESFRMTTYVAQNTNGFWFPNNQNYNTKSFLTKVTNIEDPSNVKYFPVAFNYVNNSMRATSLWNDANCIYASNAARIWNGSSFVIIYDARQMQGSSTTSYILRPFILGEWKFVDIFVLEGGVPAYNTVGAKIRINDSTYMYLSNSLLLKVTD
jgi:hypothetical protein